MNIYGPSAATGIGAGSATLWLSGFGLGFALLAAFTMVSAVCALLRIAPHFGRR